ncbi:MAG: GNAT family N-acetyltransferase [Bryobacteraceae bacterium]|nr:GNAT family N-acetyltransferase [Bryobacteraceae bacterium]
MHASQESSAILVQAWDALNQGSPGFESRRGGLIDISWNGHPCAFFNLAATVQPPASIAAFRDSVIETSAWAAQRGVPWIFVLTPALFGDLLPAAEDQLGLLGFAPLLPLTGMEAHELFPPVRQGAAEKLTEAEPGLGGKIIRLNEAAYEMKFGEPGSMHLEADGWWTSPGRLATLLEDEGEPVSSAVVLDAAATRYVALVATSPARQRQGFAEAAMRDVLARALAAGLPRRTYLHASAAGRPVYLRMGYRVTAEHTVYVKTDVP